MNLTTLVGMVAGTLTTLAFLPQVVKTWRSKSAKDLSLGTFSLFCAGILMWLFYGLLVSDWPIIITNGVTLVLAGTILIMAVRYRRSELRE